MNKMKIYVIDKTEKLSKGLKGALELVCERINVKEITNVSWEKGIKIIPTNYDLYFIHYDNLEDKKPIERLKEKKPKAFLIGIDRGGATWDNKELTNLFNKRYRLMDDFPAGERPFPFLEDKIKDALKHN